MNNIIWKWPLAVVDRQEIEMPVGARILTVQMQHGVPTLWALCVCDADAPQSARRFAIYPTGCNVPAAAGEYVGTFQMLDGGLVWHLFEVAIMMMRKSIARASDGSVESVMVMACAECGHESFAVFELERMPGHAHYQCAACDVTFCDNTCSGITAVPS